MKDGFLFIDKDIDWTSRDVCNKVQGILETKKVGHTGTLDPFATGLLLVCVNKGNKASFYLDDMDKTYIATLKLGVKTNTADLTGEVTETKDIPLLSKDIINKCFTSLEGDMDQIPPMTSAIKINGVKLYQLAHLGQEIERKPRHVIIKKLTLISFNNDEIVFEANVSKGTYIRTLGETIAESLNTVGHLISLRRTKVGPFTLDGSKHISDVNENNVIKIADVMERVYPSYIANDLEILAIKNGSALNIKDNIGETIFIKDKEDNALAIYQRKDDKYICLRGLW